MQDNVWRGKAGGQGGAGRRAHGGRVFKLAGEGKDWPLTRVRRVETLSALSSLQLSRLLEGACGLTLKGAELHQVGATSKTYDSQSAIRVCGADGERERG